MKTKMIWHMASWVLAGLLLAFVVGHASFAQAKPQATTWTVNNSGDDGNTNPANCNAGNVNTCRLRDAIAAASSGDTINFAADYSIGLAGSQLDISKDLTIDGTGHTITIDGQHSTRVFFVYSGYTLNLNVLTVANGYEAFNGGGGIYNEGTLNVTNSTFSGNRVYYAVGGGIYNIGTVNVTNSTFSDNHAYGSGSIGGGISNGGTINVTNSTLSRNSGTEGGDGIINDGPATFKNTILANNYPGDNCSLMFVAITDGGNNLEDANTCGFGATSLINTNPQLGVLTGSPAYFPLNYNSPAIDAGNASTCAATPVNGLDQRGKPRNDLQCDIGAYEMQMSDHNSTTLTPIPGGIMRTFGPPLAGIQVTAGSTGAVTVTKVTNWTPPQPSNAIKAWWNITPTNASGWTANLELCFLDSTELNGLTAANLHLWRYNGSIWSDMGRSSASGNCVQVNGITGFSRWTLATGNPGISRLFPLIFR